jgi:hypothetical protein
LHRSIRCFIFSFLHDIHWYCVILDAWEHELFSYPAKQIFSCK